MQYSGHSALLKNHCEQLFLEKEWSLAVQAVNSALRALGRGRGGIQAGACASPSQHDSQEVPLASMMHIQVFEY